MRKRLATATLTSTLAAAALLSSGSMAPAEAQPAVRILVNALYEPSTTSFSESVAFTSYLEQATSNRDYERDKGVLFEVGAIVGITESFGVMGSFEMFDGSVDATYRENLPHPLFFDQPRALDGALTDLTYSERALHVDGVFTHEFSSWTVDVFGGPTFFFTTTEVLSTVTTRSDYPFDELSLVGTETEEVDDKPFGFNFGGSLTYRFTDMVGLAFQARYSQATVSFTSPSGNTVELDAGGLRVGGGIRFAF